MEPLVAAVALGRQVAHGVVDVAPRSHVRVHHRRFPAQRVVGHAGDVVGRIGHLRQLAQHVVAVAGCGVQGIGPVPLYSRTCTVRPNACLVVVALVQVGVDHGRRPAVVAGEGRPRRLDHLRGPPQGVVQRLALGLVPVGRVVAARRAGHLVGQAALPRLSGCVVAGVAQHRLPGQRRALALDRPAQLVEEAPALQVGRRGCAAGVAALLDGDAAGDARAAQCVAVEDHRGRVAALGLARQPGAQQPAPRVVLVAGHAAVGVGPLQQVARPGSTTLLATCPSALAAVSA